MKSRSLRARSRDRGPRVSLIPVGHHVCPALAAAITPHPQSKGRHGGISWQVIDVDDGLMAALNVRAMDDQRPHAILAHIAEGHRGWIGMCLALRAYTANVPIIMFWCHLPQLRQQDSRWSAGALRL